MCFDRLVFLHTLITVAIFCPCFQVMSVNVHFVQRLQCSILPWHNINLAKLSYIYYIHHHTRRMVAHKKKTDRETT